MIMIEHYMSVFWIFSKIQGKERCEDCDVEIEKCIQEQKRKKEKE